MESPRCVHTEPLPEVGPRELAPGWTSVMRHREQVLKALEEARDTRGLDNPLDAGIALQVLEAEFGTLRDFEPELADLCGVSRFHLTPGSETRCEVIDLREQARCERSWKRDGTVSQRSDGGWLSERDWQAVSTGRPQSPAQQP